MLDTSRDYFSINCSSTDLKKKAIRGAGATIFASFLSFAVHFLSTIILARLLTPDDFGRIAMITTFSVLLQNCGLNGFTEAVIQKNDITHDDVSTLFWLNILITGCLTILFIMISPFFAWFYHDSQLTYVAVGLSFAIITTGLGTLHMAILRRNMQFYRVSVINVTAYTLSLATAITLAWLKYGYWALIVNIVAFPLFVAIGSWLFCGWRPGIQLDIKRILPLLSFATNTYGNFVVNYFSRNIDKLLIGWHYNALWLGYYKKAYDLFALPASQLIAPIHSVALAALSRLTNNPEKYRKYYLDTISVIGFVGMFLSLVLTVTGKDVVFLVLGAQWAATGKAFSYFGASIGIMLIYSTQGWIHLSLGRVDRWLRWGILECILTTGFFMVGLPFGTNGIALAYTILLYLLLVPCLHYAGQPIGLRSRSIISAIWRYFLAGIIGWLLSFPVIHSNSITFFSSTNHGILVKLILSCLLCLVIYLTVIIILYKGIEPIRKSFTILQQMIPKFHNKKSTSSSFLDSNRET